MTIDSTSARATSPEQLGPLGNLLLEDSRTAVWSLEIPPGESCDWHVHEHPYLLIVLEGEQLVVEFALGDAAPIVVDTPPGLIMYVDKTTSATHVKDQEPGSGPVGPEIAHNRSSVPFRELIIELKEGTGPVEYTEARF